MIRYNIRRNERRTVVPIITGKGVPAGLEKGKKVYDQLKHDIAVAAATTRGLEDIGFDEVEVFLISDLGTVGNALVFEVTGIFERPDRTPEVYRRLEENICRVLRSFASKWIPACTTVEAEVIHKMKPKDLTLYVRPDILGLRIRRFKRIRFK